jgi:hypothetical protein
LWIVCRLGGGRRWPRLFIRSRSYRWWPRYTGRKWWYRRGLLDWLWTRRGILQLSRYDRRFFGKDVSKNGQEIEDV